MSQLCRSVQYAYRSKNLLRLNMRLRYTFSKYAELGHFNSRCCFVEGGNEMFKDSKCTCRTIVLLIKPFVW